LLATWTMIVGTAGIIGITGMMDDYWQVIGFPIMIFGVYINLELFVFMNDYWNYWYYRHCWQNLFRIGESKPAGPGSAEVFFYIIL
jgi:hypothetical protein